MLRATLAELPRPTLAAAITAALLTTAILAWHLIDRLTTSVIEVVNDGERTTVVVAPADRPPAPPRAPEEPRSQRLPFTTAPGLGLRVAVEMPADENDQQAKAQMEKIRNALRDLGLDDSVEFS